MEVGFRHSSVCPTSWHKSIKHKCEGCGLKRTQSLERKYKEIRIKFLVWGNDGFPRNEVLQK